MSKAFLAILLFISAISIAAASGTSNTPVTARAFLSTYISNSVINSSVFSNFTYSNNNYSLIKLPSGKYMLMNDTKGFSIVLNDSAAYAILHPYLVNKYYPNATLVSLLTSSMQSYRSQAQPPLADCLVETGLDVFSCTVANNCQSCLAVPNCGRRPDNPFSETGGATGPFGEAIMNFSSHYNELNSSYNAYFSMLSRLNKSNIGGLLPALADEVANISSVSRSLPQNPLFPLPSNFSVGLLASCSNYIPSQAPYYCVDFGYCEATSFNSTKLANIQTMLSSLSSLPLSNSSAKAFSSSAVSTADSYVQPVIVAKETALFDAFMNYSSPIYNSTLANATSLSSRISNSSLQGSIAAFEAVFSNIKSSGIEQNITSANASFASAVKNLSASYSKIEALYAPIKSEQFNNTVELLYDQLNYQVPPPSIASLSVQQQRINAEMQGQVNNSQLYRIKGMLDALHSNITQSSPISLPAFVKTFDGGFVSSLLYGSSSTIPSKESSAPLYTALFSFLIGVILIAVFYVLTYGRLNRKKKIRRSKKVIRAWIYLIVLLIVLDLVYASVTFAVAASANSFMPLSSFASALKSSNTVVLAITVPKANVSIGSTGIPNLTSNSISVFGRPTSLSSECADSVLSNLTAAHKLVVSALVSNYSCAISDMSGNLSGSECYNKMLASNDPMIIINQTGNSSSISYKGLYGTVLYASGEPAEGNSCYLSGIVKYALNN